MQTYSSNSNEGSKASWTIEGDVHKKETKKDFKGSFAKARKENALSIGDSPNNKQRRIFIVGVANGLCEWHPPFPSFLSVSTVWGANPIVFGGENVKSSFSRHFSLAKNLNPSLTYKRLFMYTIGAENVTYIKNWWEFIWCNAMQCITSFELPGMFLIVTFSGVAASEL